MVDIMEKNENNISKSENYMGNIYFNGFEVGFSNSDAHIDILLNSEKIAVLNMSFGTLKTLSEISTKLVNDIENRTSKVLSISEFKKQMKESMEENDIIEKEITEE